MIQKVLRNLVKLFSESPSLTSMLPAGKLRYIIVDLNVGVKIMSAFPAFSLATCVLCVFFYGKLFDTVAEKA